MDVSFLSKLMQLNPEGVASLANMAAMKGSPPQIGPSNPGMLAPGAFAGIMDPSIGQVPQGVQPAMGMPQMGGQAAVPQMNPQNNPGLSAQQLGAMAPMMQQPNLQFPGGASFARPNQVQMSPIGVPQGGPQQTASLAQLLGR